MATIYIDNQPYQVKDGQNLLAACLSLGFDLPYFCWHPAMHSVGACRQCAVKQFKDAADLRGRIVMACMTPAAEGTRISIDDPEARAFRKGIVELLMVNHPHDCPVCDEGGECHLQDMTVMTGHVYRAFRFKKRTYRNQDLGPFVSHEMNRCIQCYRCVRFYKDYAGGTDLDVLGWHDHVYFGRSEDGTLESEFSGNLVEVCPTGVFTDKTFKQHYTRKWDLQGAPSICPHCGLGCNTIPGERYGELRRIRNRYHGQVNGYFICDRGRYGYEFVNSPGRIRQVLRQMRSGKPVADTAPEGLLEVLGTIVGESGAIIGIGSPRASLEANFALRHLVGPERFCLGIPRVEAGLIGSIIDILRTGPARTPPLRDSEHADAALVLGEDLTNVAPRMALALRQSVRRRPMEAATRLGPSAVSSGPNSIPEWNDAAVREVIQQDRGPLLIATPDATRLDDVATGLYRAGGDDIARLGFAIAHELDATCPAPSDSPEEVRRLARAFAEALRSARRPLVVSGTSCRNQGVIQAAANVARALHTVGKPAELAFTVPECNSLGLALMGGMSLEDAAGALRGGSGGAIVVLENDLYRRRPAAEADALLGSAKTVIALDHLETATTRKAHLVLPTATFAESDGTLVSGEGRAQRFFKVFPPAGQVREGWRWLAELMVVCGREQIAPWQTFDDILRAMVEELPVLAGVAETAPASDFRLVAQKVPRQPNRYSGRTAMHAGVEVSEPRPPDDPDSPLSFSMEGYDGLPPPALLSNVWAPSWNSVQAYNKFQAEVGGELVGGDPGRRLIEPPPAGAKPGYLGAPPASVAPREGHVWVEPAYHIFGSEELSIHSPGIARLAPGPYVGLSAEDARTAGLTDGDQAELVLGGQVLRLPVRIGPGLPAGLAVAPAGLPQLPGVILPGWGKVCRAAGTGGSP